MAAQVMVEILLLVVCSHMMSNPAQCGRGEAFGGSSVVKIV